MVALRSNQLYEIATNPWVLNTGPSIDSEKSIMLRQHIPNTWKKKKIRKWEQNGTKERKTNQWVNGRARSTNIHPESQSKIIKERSSRRAKLDRQASPVISTVMMISWWAHHLNVHHCNIIISFIIHSCGIQSWKVWPIDQVRSLVMVNKYIKPAIACIKSAQVLVHICSKGSSPLVAIFVSERSKHTRERKRSLRWRRAQPRNMLH